MDLNSLKKKKKEKISPLLRSQGMIMAIAQECERNFWDYLNNKN